MWGTPTSPCSTAWQPEITATRTRELSSWFCQVTISLSLYLSPQLFKPFVPVACLRIDCKQTKTKTYKAIQSLIHSSDDFFEFIYYHQKIFRKKPRGMGAGQLVLVFLLNVSKYF